MHDWWAYLVVSALGKVIYDAEPRVLYRQHARSVVGAQHGFVTSWAARIRRFRRKRHLLPLRQQAEEFRRLYGARLNTEHATVLDRFLTRPNSLRQRVAYALSGEVWRQSKVDDVILRVLLAANRV